LHKWKRDIVNIAIQEDMLPGRSILEKFERAKALGVQGIEFWGRDLAPKVESIMEAVERTGLRAASVNHGRQGRFLDTDPIERERALEELRNSITCAADIGAEGVIFVPHFFGPLMPDLTPYMSPVELEAEMLHAHLRTLSDYADAMGVNLYVEPVNRYETHFLNRLEQAARVARRINHPRVKIVADLFHMALEEADLVAVIRENADVIGHVHLADSNRRLPGQGFTNFAQMADALKAINYAGWAAFECGNPGDNAPVAEQYLSELPACLDMLRRAGWA
jgi:sugar phosphate isomerase/epimerase